MNRRAASGPPLPGWSPNASEARGNLGLIKAAPQPPRARHPAARSNQAEREEGGLRILDEPANCQELLPHQFSDHIRRGVPHAQPDHFRGRPMNKTALIEIRVLRNENESTINGIRPERSILGSEQIYVADMRGARIEFLQPRQQAERKILIEQ